MAETWLEELPTGLLFGDHRGGKSTQETRRVSQRRKGSSSSPRATCPHLLQPLSRNEGLAWLTPGPLPSENLPLKLITDKYQLVSSLQEVLGLGGGSELHLRRVWRKGSLSSKGFAQKGTFWQFLCLERTFFSRTKRQHSQLFFVAFLTDFIRKKEFSLF